MKIKRTKAHCIAIKFCFYYHYHNKRLTCRSINNCIAQVYERWRQFSTIHCLLLISISIILLWKNHHVVPITHITFFCFLHKEINTSLLQHICQVVAKQATPNLISLSFQINISAVFNSKVNSESFLTKIVKYFLLIYFCP